MRKQSMGSMVASSSMSKTPCCSKVGLKRGPWTAAEDELLTKYIKREGAGRWRTLPNRAGLLRCGKSCRLRWMNYLRPSVKRGQIAPDEEDLILRLHRLLGNRWSLIAGRIPGRTDNEIKNYWNTNLSKKLISQGIDPRTHKPLNPNPSGDAPPVPSKPILFPEHNPNHSSSGLDQSGGSSLRGKACNHEYFKGTSMDRDFSAAVDDNRGTDENWQNSYGLMTGLQSSCHGKSNGDDDVDCCTDDMFSSFFNSLIDQDLFANQQQQANGIAPSSNPFVPPEWDAAFMSSTAALNEDEPRQFADHVNKQ